MIVSIQARALLKPAKFALRALKLRMPTKASRNAKPLRSVLGQFEAMMAHQTDLVFHDINVD